MFQALSEYGMMKNKSLYKLMMNKKYNWITIIITYPMVQMLCRRVITLNGENGERMFLILLNSLLLFSYYHLMLWYPPTHTQSPHNCPCPWVHGHGFLSSISHPLTSHSIAVMLRFIYPYVSILLIRSLCSLDSPYKWNHMVFVFLWQVYFTGHKVLQVHPCWGCTFLQFS